LAARIEKLATSAYFCVFHLTEEVSDHVVEEGKDDG
jgi:hypothetical protein